MSVQCTTRRLAWGIALVLACGAGLLGCSREESKGLDELATELRGCPRGDDLWLAAIAAAEREERLEDLLALSRDIADTCVDRWEPAWTAGDCLLRMDPLQSRADYEDALLRARAADDPTGIACAANRLGALAHQLGEPAAAEALLGEALEAAQRAGRDDLECFVRNSQD